MKKILELLQRAYGRIDALATVPTAIAVLLWLLTIAVLVVDAHFPLQHDSDTLGIFVVDFATAKDLVSLIASASITTLGLVYSIVLVVFTTAAGNIGPRLLQRFTDDRINQITAGVFGGTYLSALTVLHQAEDVFVPLYGTTLVYVLATVCMFQLILFVRSAATSVTIDEEVAEVSAQLDREISNLMDREEREDETRDVPKADEPAHQITTDRDGYISYIEADPLIDFAERHDTFITLKFAPGDFIISGMEIASVSHHRSDDEIDELHEILHDAIEVRRSRTPDADVEFSINLLVEIALRALSPGVNDTYTAIACSDRISSALARPIAHGLRDGIRVDGNDVPRLCIPNQTIETILGTAFGPLRRAAQGNVLMTRHLLGALSRLGELADGDALRLVQNHARLVLEEAEGIDLHADDLDYLRRSGRDLLRRRMPLLTAGKDQR